MTNGKRQRQMDTVVSFRSFHIQGLPIPPFLVLAKNRRYSETTVLNLRRENPYLGLEMGGGIGSKAVLGGRRYWEGRL